MAVCRAELELVVPENSVAVKEPATEVAAVVTEINSGDLTAFVPKGRTEVVEVKAGFVGSEKRVGKFMVVGGCVDGAEDLAVPKLKTVSGEEADDAITDEMADTDGNLNEKGDDDVVVMDELSGREMVGANDGTFAIVDEANEVGDATEVIGEVIEAESGVIGKGNGVLDVELGKYALETADVVSEFGNATLLSDETLTLLTSDMEALAVSVVVMVGSEKAKVKYGVVIGCVVKTGWVTNDGKQITADFVVDEVVFREISEPVELVATDVTETVGTELSENISVLAAECSVADG